MEEVEQFQGEPLTSEERGAILHRLNREAVNTRGKKVMLNAEDFKKTQGKWAGVPIIFAKTHPSPGLNMAKRLAEVDGKLMGAVKNAEVVMEGSPRLIANLELETDRNFDRLNKAGKLEISPAWTPSNEGPIPDHVLIYEGGSIPAGDPGAMMFQRLSEDPKAFLGEMFQKAKDLVKEEAKAMGDLEDVKAQLQAFQNTEKQKAAELLSFQEKVKALETEKAEKEKLLNAFQEKAKAEAEKAEQEKKDARWNAFQREFIPVGWKTPDKVVQTRKDYEESPHAFMEKLQKFQMGVTPAAGTDGQENAGAANPTHDPNKNVGDWVYDPATGKYGWK